jgi:hypothetical protein
VGTGNTIANTAGVKDCFEKWRKAIIAGRLKEAYKRTSVAFLSKIVLTFFQTPRIPDRVKDGLIEKLPVDKRKIFGEWSRMNLGLKRPSILPKYYFDSGWVFEVYKKDFEYSQTSALLKDMVIKNIGIDAAGASIMVRHPVIGTAFYCLIIEDKMWKLDDFIPPATLPR